MGPNCPGIICPGRATVGIMPTQVFNPGRVGLVSRSGTLTYQISKELALLGIGQSTVVGIGGDPVVGSSFIDILARFEADPETDLVVMVGEIGGAEEEKAAEFIAEYDVARRSSPTSPASRPLRASRWATPGPSSRARPARRGQEGRAGGRGRARWGPTPRRSPSWSRPTWADPRRSPSE